MEPQFLQETSQTDTHVYVMIIYKIIIVTYTCICLRCLLDNIDILFGAILPIVAHGLITHTLGGDAAVMPDGVNKIMLEDAFSWLAFHLVFF